jgi:hypothetical protein
MSDCPLVGWLCLSDVCHFSGSFPIKLFHLRRKSLATGTLPQMPGNLLTLLLNLRGTQDIELENMFFNVLHPLLLFSFDILALNLNP